VRLEGILNDEKGLRLHVSGIDAIDGTPILDIKPYLPYADALPQASGGFAQQAPQWLKVRWHCQPPQDEALRLLLEQTLSLGPSPAYHADAQRSYRARLAGHEVEWRQSADQVEILALRAAGS
jgi:hypothetical protein